MDELQFIVAKLNEPPFQLSLSLVDFDEKAPSKTPAAAAAVACQAPLDYTRRLSSKHLACFTTAHCGAGHAPC